MQWQNENILYKREFFVSVCVLSQMSLAIETSFMMRSPAETAAAAFIRMFSVVANSRIEHLMWQNSDS